VPKLGPDVTWKRVRGGGEEADFTSPAGRLNFTRRRTSQSWNTRTETGGATRTDPAEGDLPSDRTVSRRLTSTRLPSAFVEGQRENLQ